MDSDTIMIITWFLVGVGVVSICGTMYWCYKLYKYIRDPYFEYTVDETAPQEPPPQMYNTLKSNIMRRMANTLRRATKKKVHKIVKQDNSCTICLEPLNNAENSVNSSGESALGLLKCGHIFHFECIWRWFRAHFSCPVCRTQANITLDDIKAISVAAFENAVSSNTLPSYYRRKANKKKAKKAGSKESVATSLSGAESDSSSAPNSPGRSSTASPNFIILEGGNIGESDESLNTHVYPQMRSKFRPNVRHHKFKKKSEPDLHALSLTSLASIPEIEVDLSANSSATMPSFGHPVVMGRFTSQTDGTKTQSEGETPQQNGHVVSGIENTGGEPVSGGSSSPSHVQPNCEAKTHLANYAPTKQQMQKLENTMTQSSLWNSSISQYSDGVISMLNLVQEEQQAETMRDAIQEEIRRSIVFNEKDKTLVVAPDATAGEGMVESTSENIEIPKSIRANWILKK